MMKKLFLLLTILLSFSAKADYGSYHFTLNMEMTTGEEVIGYTEIGMAYIDLDSLKTPGYTKRILAKMLDSGYGNIQYFKIRIAYDYAFYPGEKKSIYSLHDLETLSVSKIKDIEVTQIIEASYAIGIGNIKPADKTWMDKPPVDSFTVNSNSCFYTIMIHEKSKKLDKTVKQIKALEATLPDADLGEENEDYHSKLNKLLQKLQGLKAVVVGSCTC